jgi:CubicO group peptidase (beta-lactamase class C family)
VGSTLPASADAGADFESRSLQELIRPEDRSDAQRVCAFIADHPPWWPPGTQTGYHALTLGFVLEEVVQRPTGRPLAVVLHDEIAAPLRVASELRFGVPTTC